MESLPNLVRQAPTAAVDGIWQRHAPARHASTALNGRLGVSRWGTPEGFPILYLGRPTASVIVEAYRHLVDPVDDPSIIATLAPRVLVTCEVHVTEVLDLRTATARMSTGLSRDVLESGTHHRAAYERCQTVAAVARQLGLRGLITPAATTLGETLALFTDRLPAAERPVRLRDELWSELPADPRGTTQPRLRIVRDHD